MPNLNVECKYFYNTNTFSWACQELKKKNYVPRPPRILTWIKRQSISQGSRLHKHKSSCQANLILEDKQMDHGQSHLLQKCEATECQITWPWFCINRNGVGTAPATHPPKFSQYSQSDGKWLFPFMIEEKELNWEIFKSVISYSLGGSHTSDQTSRTHYSIWIPGQMALIVSQCPFLPHRPPTAWVWPA